MPSLSPSHLAQLRRNAVTQAVVSWSHAPGHVRVLASQYVGPILDALQSMSAEQDARDQAAARADNRDGLAL